MYSSYFLDYQQTQMSGIFHVVTNEIFTTLVMNNAAINCYFSEINYIRRETHANYLDLDMYIDEVVKVSLVLLVCCHWVSELQKGL